MAIDTGNSLMCAGELKIGLLMFDERVVGGLESQACVALFAAIVPWSRRKLPLVFVFVAIQAKSEFDFISSVLACRNMTVCTLFLGMWRDQREAGLGMVRDRVS